MTIKDLNPKKVWNNFYSLTRIPRPSKHEQKVEAFLLEWGKEHGIDTFKDETGNIIMRKPATPGYEKRRGVIIQGHMDMVPQKTNDTVHDFLTDPIETQIIDGWVGAKGTTLGADDGIGVAIGMTVMEDENLKHGPLEVLVTYDEETGMTGATMLKPGILKGDILLNLDSEEEGELCIGCAGGLDAIADFSYETEKTPSGYAALLIEVKGLQGGHSGMDISLYRANANKVAARILLDLINKYGAKLADFHGGNMRNAIPFEAKLTVLVPADKKAAAAEEAKAVFALEKAEHSYSDPKMLILVDDVETPASYIDDKTALRAVKAIMVCPNGVIRMSDSMPGLTETSTNLAIVSTTGGHLTIHSLMRSSIDSAKANLAQSMQCLFELAGASFKTEGGYCGWVPKPETPVYQVIKDTYKSLFGKEIKVTATHGGLECALLGAKYPEWEMVSIGPTIVHPHSPDERVNIESVGKAYEFVAKFLENVPLKK